MHKSLLLTAGARLGTYSPIKGALGGDKEHSNLFRNVAAGCLSGSLAAAATNPVDLIKTRLQAKGSPYRNAWAIVRAVVAEQGISGLWAGTTPSVARTHSMHSRCSYMDPLGMQLLHVACC